MRTHSFCVILLLCENCWSRQDTARTNSSTWHHTLSSPPISPLPLCWMVTWLVSQWPHPIRAALIYKIITLFVPPLPCWQNGIAHCPSPLWNWTQSIQIPYSVDKWLHGSDYCVERCGIFRRILWKFICRSGSYRSGMCEEVWAVDQWVLINRN